MAASSNRVVKGSGFFANIRESPDYPNNYDLLFVTPRKPPNTVKGARPTSYKTDNGYSSRIIRLRWNPDKGDWSGSSKFTLRQLTALPIFSSISFIDPTKLLDSVHVYLDRCRNDRYPFIWWMSTTTIPGIDYGHIFRFNSGRYCTVVGEWTFPRTEEDKMADLCNLSPEIVSSIKSNSGEKVPLDLTHAEAEKVHHVFCLIRNVLNIPTISIHPDLYDDFRKRLGLSVFEKKEGPCKHLFCDDSWLSSNDEHVLDWHQTLPGE